MRQQAGWKSASTLLLEKQLLLLGKVLREDVEGPLHHVSFIPGTVQPATSRYVRKVGRPRKEWISSLLPEAYRVAGGLMNLETAVQDKLYWKRLVKAALDQISLSSDKVHGTAAFWSDLAAVSFLFMSVLFAQAFES